MKKNLVPLLCAIVFICAIIGIVKINIINTEILSPLGTTDNNYSIVSEEFGEDFTEFIKDNSPLKIYIGEKGDKQAKVRIFNKDINLTLNNPFIKGVEPVFKFIDDKYDAVKEKLNNKEQKENTNNNKEKIDKIVDDYIQWQDSQNNNDNSENNEEYEGSGE